MQFLFYDANLMKFKYIKKFGKITVDEKPDLITDYQRCPENC